PPQFAPKLPSEWIQWSREKCPTEVGHGRLKSALRLRTCKYVQTPGARFLKLGAGFGSIDDVALKVARSKGCRRIHVTLLYQHLFYVAINGRDIVHSVDRVKPDGMPLELHHHNVGEGTRA